MVSKMGGKVYAHSDRHQDSAKCDRVKVQVLKAIFTIILCTINAVKLFYKFYLPIMTNSQ